LSRAARAAGTPAARNRSIIAKVSWALSDDQAAQARSRFDEGSSNGSAESFRNCDPSGSLSNLRRAVPVDFVTLLAA